jgi:hypothetical protein
MRQDAKRRDTCRPNADTRFRICKERPHDMMQETLRRAWQSGRLSISINIIFLFTSKHVTPVYQLRCTERFTCVPLPYFSIPRSHPRNHHALIIWKCPQLVRCYRTSAASSTRSLLQNFCCVLNSLVATELLQLKRHKKAFGQTNQTFKIISCPHIILNPLKPSGNYMYHLLQQSVTLHFVCMCFVWFSL